MINILIVLLTVHICILFPFFALFQQIFGINLNFILIRINKMSLFTYLYFLLMKLGKWLNVAARFKQLRFAEFAGVQVISYSILFAVWITSFQIQTFRFTQCCCIAADAALPSPSCYINLHGNPSLSLIGFPPCGFIYSINSCNDRFDTFVFLPNFNKGNTCVFVFHDFYLYTITAMVTFLNCYPRPPMLSLAFLGFS